MTTPSIQDQRLTSAAELVASGRIKLLSIDVFDTLLARRVPKPTDVFLRLGVRLHDQNKLGPGQTPDSFAAIRYQTEYAARDAQQRLHNNREVTLAEIYAKVPSQIVRATVGELVAGEIATEHELCFSNPEIVQLAQLAKQHNVRVALISNTYFSESVLRELVHTKAPTLPTLDGFFVSDEHRRGKRDGLMQKMLDTFGVKPPECVHVGDDPISDRATAASLGIPCIYYGHSEDDFSERLTEEHPIQWHERATHFADVNGDYSLTWLRRQAGHWRIPDMQDEDKAHFIYGAQMVGPLLTGFAAWVNARLQSENGERIYGIAREGVLLTKLISVLDDKTDCRILATSRMAAALASFSPDYPDHLEDFLTRRGHWTLDALMGQLGFDSEQTRTIGDPEATLDALPARELTRTLLTSPLAKILHKRSAESRRRILTHLKKIGALENNRLFLFDLGYAATIQRALQRIFTIEKIPVTTHGLYLVSAHVSLATQAAGGVVEGFLAQNGNPNDFARAFCRSPEVVELSCMPPYGTVIDYEPDGAPVYDDDTAPKSQQYEVAIVQQGITCFAKLFRDRLSGLPTPPDFATMAWRAQMRAVATRMVIYPTQSETRLTGHWMAVSAMGLTVPCPIVSAGQYIDQIDVLTAERLVGLPRRDVPWLYGVAASVSHPLARRVASLMLRKELPATFSESPTRRNGSNSFFEVVGTSPILSPYEISDLRDLADAALNDYIANGRFERKQWMQLLMRPALSDRKFIFSYLAKCFEERGNTKYAHGLLKKLWRIGGRDYNTFKALRSILETKKPGHDVWTFLKEACFAAAAANDAGYVIDAVGFAHAMTYNGYNARIPYNGFQDCVSIATMKHVLAPLRIRLPPLEPVANRPLRLCYVLAGEIDERYSPIADLALALLETHDNRHVEIAVASTHTESQVMNSPHARTRMESLRARGCKTFFWQKTSSDSQVINLESFSAEIAKHRFDSLIFSTFTNMPVFLALLRPAHLMVGLGFGDIDIYSSPLLDFTAHMCDFPKSDSLCNGYSLPDFVPQGRFRVSEKPLTKKELGIPDTSLLIISSGRPIKFYSESYWKVVTNILKQRTHVYLAIIGPTYAEMQEWLKPHLPEALQSRVQFLGWRHDHAQVLAAADIGLDTFPMCGGFNLTEIMYLGIPAILCHNKTEEFLGPYSNEIFMPIGELVDIPELNLEWGDVEGITRTAFKLIDEPAWRRDLGIKAKEAALNRSNAKRSAEALENLIRKHLETFAQATDACPTRIG